MAKIKILTQWQANSYDVWGNSNDGYQVNHIFNGDMVDITIELTCHNAGTPNEFYSGQPSDLQIKHALGINPRISIEDNVQSENTCFPEHASTGYPLGELELVSHDSLTFYPDKLVTGHKWIYSESTNPGTECLYFTLANRSCFFAGMVGKKDNVWSYCLPGELFTTAQSDSDTIKPVKKTAKHDLMEHAIATFKTDYQFTVKYVNNLE